MTDEEKKAAQEAKEAEAKAEAEAEATDEQTTEEKAEAEAKAKATEESKQLEAQLQKEKEAREKAEKAAADANFKLREKQRKVAEAGEEDEGGEKPLTRAEVQAMMDSNNKVAQEEEMKAIVAQMTDDDKERELVLLTHKNRSYPSHLSLKEQLDEAYLVANKDKIQGQNQELMRALAGKKNASTDGSQTYHDSPRGSEPSLAPADKAELASQGWKWNGKSKRHEKKLSKGLLIRHKDGSTEFLKS